MAEELEVRVGRIEMLDIDAIVNAANRALAPGGGVDGAIRSAAGPELARLLAAAGAIGEGAALTTPGFRLPARWIIHTAAPVWSAPGLANEKIATMRACYSACLTAGAEVGIAEIAFPALGTGAFGWPKPLACETAVGVARAHPAPIRRVVFCCFT
ncbi:MAG: macro domain-containing protein, partial [Hyphomonadaceae bacterium]